jgi:hypothetical protein
MPTRSRHERKNPAVGDLFSPLRWPLWAVIEPLCKRVQAVRLQLTARPVLPASFPCKALHHGHHRRTSGATQPDFSARRLGVIVPVVMPIIMSTSCGNKQYDSLSQLASEIGCDDLEKGDNRLAGRTPMARKDVRPRNRRDVEGSHRWSLTVHEAVPITDES